MSNLNKASNSNQAGSELAYNDLTKHNNLWGVNRRGAKLQVSEKLISVSINEGWVSSLAIYFLLKHKFRNSCLFGYQRRKSEISRLARISPNTLHKRIEILSNKGLVYFHAGNLILKSIHKLKKELGERHACTLHIPGNTSLKNIEYLLYSKDLHRRARRQRFKAKHRDQSKKGELGENDVWPLISLRTLACYWNCSVYKVKTIFDWLTEAKLIKKQTVSKNYGEVSVKQIDPMIYPGPGWPYVNRRNELVLVYGTTLQFFDYPLKTPNINDYGRN